MILEEVKVSYLGKIFFVSVFDLIRKHLKPNRELEELNQKWILNVLHPSDEDIEELKTELRRLVEIIKSDDSSNQKTVGKSLK